MSLWKDTDPRFVHLERKVGLFVLVAATVAVAVIVFVVIERGLLVPKTKLTFTAESGKDLREGMAVKFSGFRIGKVDRLTLMGWAEVNVTMSIDKRYMNWIRSDSKAILTQEGVIGDPIIEITPGSPMARELNENAMIQFDRRAGINDMLGQLDEIKRLLADIRQADIGKTFANAKRMSEELLISREHLDAVLDSAQQTLTKMDAVADHAGHTIAKSDDAVTKFDTLLGTTAAAAARADSLIAAMETEFPLFVDKADNVLNNLEVATGDLRMAARDAPSMAQRGGELLDETSAILDAVETLWPIRSRIPQRQYKMLPVDADE
jgi:phospholipid/cholesterol/gamma-HCH transport system substrate-binding protein